MLARKAAPDVFIFASSWASVRFWDACRLGRLRLKAVWAAHSASRLLSKLAAEVLAAALDGDSEEDEVPEADGEVEDDEELSPPQPVRTSTPAATAARANSPHPVGKRGTLLSFADHWADR
jgi:hypothetical protein